MDTNHSWAQSAKRRIAVLALPLYVASFIGTSVVSALPGFVPLAQAVSPVPACDPLNTFDTFTLGSVNGQDSWSATGPYDQEIVTNTYGYPTFGCQSLRVSDAIASGSFGDWIFAKPLTNAVGETDATAGAFSEGTRQNHFEVQLDVASTIPGAQQPGLHIAMSPDRGDGSRMSYLRFDDNAGGMDVTFFDVQGTTSPANFVSTVVGTGLNRTVPHTFKLTFDAIDGPSNDVVKVYIDGSLMHTGTSWENYYRYDSEAISEQSPRIVKTIIIQARGASTPANDGNGYLFDNLTMSSSATIVPASCVPVDEGVVFYLPFDETSGTNAADVTGNGFDGTHINGPVISSDTPTLDYPNARSVDFDGVNDYVNLGHPSFVTPTAFSVSAWVNADTVGIDRQVISKGYNGTQTEWEMKTTSADGKMSFQTYNGTQFGVEALTPIVADVWTHYVGTFDGTTWKIYVNGTLDNSNAGAAPVPTAQPIHIGAVDSLGTPVQFWHGNIDDTRFFDRALTIDEVVDLYGGACDVSVGSSSSSSFESSSSSSSSSPAACVPDTASLVGYWKLDEPSGTVSLDSSGNGNDGSHTDAPVISSDTAPTTFTNPYSLLFDGSNDGVQVPDDATLDLGVHTVAAWVKPSVSNAGSNDVIVAKGGAGFGNYNYLLYFSGANDNTVTAYNSGLTPPVLNGTQIPANVWSHVAMTYDGTTRTIYVNGVAVMSDTPTGAPTMGNGLLEIAASDSGQFTFPGNVDDIRVYNAALSAEEIEDIAGGACEGDTGSSSSSSSESSSSSSSSGPAVCTPDDATLVAYWKLDELSGASATDSTVYDNAGIHQNGVTAGIAGATVSFLNPAAASYDGTDDYTLVSDTTGLPAGNDARTLAAWVNMDTVAQQATIIALGNGATSDQRFILMVGNEPAVGPTYLFTDGINGNNNIVISGADVPATGGWHHIGFTYDGAGNWAYYLDGALTQSGIFATAINTVTNAVEIGARHDSGTGYEDGSLDDVRVYNRALIAGEIADLAAGACDEISSSSSSSESSTSSSSSSTSSESSSSSSSSEQSSSSSSSSSTVGICVPTGLLAHWKLDENGGVTAIDSTGNAHTGTLSESTAYGAGPTVIIPNVSALNLDTSDDIVTVASTGLELGTTDFTLSTWMKTATGNKSILGHFNTDGGYRGYGMYLYDTGAINAFAYGTLGTSDTAKPSTLLDDQWHNVIATYDRTGDDVTISFYVDGVLLGSSIATVGDISIDTPFTIGKYTFQPNFSEGLLDDVRIYDRALTSDEASQLALNCGITGDDEEDAEEEDNNVDEDDQGDNNDDQGNNGDDSINGSNGNHIGHRLNELALITNASLNNALVRRNGQTAPPAFGGSPDEHPGIAPGAFGGSSDTLLNARQLRVICSLQDALAHNKELHIATAWVATQLNPVFSLDNEIIEAALKNTDLCAQHRSSRGQNEVSLTKQNLKPFLVKEGRPYAEGYATFNACMSGKVVSLADIRSNTDKTEGRRFNSLATLVSAAANAPHGCSQYVADRADDGTITGRLPGESQEIFSFNPKTGAVTPPEGYEVVDVL